MELSIVNYEMGLSEEAMQQAKEASEIAERHCGAAEPAASSMDLTQSSLHNQLDAAKEAMSPMIDLLSENGEQLPVCVYQHFLGGIYQLKGEIEKAIYHCEVALGIASLLNHSNMLFDIHSTLAQLFFDEGRFDDAHAHIKHAKSHAADCNDTYRVAQAMEMQARIWHGQHRLEEAKSEALRAVDAFEKLGAAKDVESALKLVRQIDHDS